MRARQTLKAGSAIDRKFQYTRPCGRDTIYILYKNIVFNFNTLAHAGETFLRTAEAGDFVISIHSPMRARLPAVFSLFTCWKFQYTRPCGRDSKNRFCNIIIEISIHSPMRARQSTSKPVEYTCYISIHSPMRARPQALLGDILDIEFQYTRPCGRDKSWVSVNASLLRFQYTRPCGRDLYVQPEYELPLEFQYTRPCGRDIFKPLQLN